MFLSLLMVSVLFQMVWSGCDVSVIANGVRSVSDGLTVMFLSLLTVSVLFQMVWSGCDVSVIANGVRSVSDGLVWL